MVAAEPDPADCEILESWVTQVNRLRITGNARHNDRMARNLIVFDCDGVLIDSELIACRASATCLTEIGIPITVDDIAERYVGVSTTSMSADLEARSGMPLGAGRLRRYSVSPPLGGSPAGWLGNVLLRGCLRGRVTPDRRDNPAAAAKFMRLPLGTAVG